MITVASAKATRDRRPPAGRRAPSRRRRARPRPSPRRRASVAAIAAQVGPAIRSPSATRAISAASSGTPACTSSTFATVVCVERHDEGGRGDGEAGRHRQPGDADRPEAAGSRRGPLRTRDEAGEEARARRPSARTPRSRGRASPSARAKSPPTLQTTAAASTSPAPRAADPAGTAAGGGGAAIVIAADTRPRAASARAPRGRSAGLIFLNPIYFRACPEFHACKSVKRLRSAAPPRGRWRSRPRPGPAGRSGRAGRRAPRGRAARGRRAGASPARSQRPDQPRAGAGQPVEVGLRRRRAGRSGRWKCSTAAGSARPARGRRPPAAGRRSAPAGTPRAPPRRRRPPAAAVASGPGGRSRASRSARCARWRSRSASRMASVCRGGAAGPGPVVLDARHRRSPRPAGRAPARRRAVLEPGEELGERQPERLLEGGRARRPARRARPAGRRPCPRGRCGRAGRRPGRRAAAAPGRAPPRAGPSASAPVRSASARASSAASIASCRASIAASRAASAPPASAPATSRAAAAAKRAPITACSSGPGRLERSPPPRLGAQQQQRLVEVGRLRAARWR